MKKVLKYFIKRVYARVIENFCHWYYAPLWCFFGIVVLCLLLFLLFIVVSIIIYRSNICCAGSSDMIVSLTSTSDRFHYELPFAIHSLLSQTQLPHKILIHLAPTSTNNLTRAHLRTAMQRLDASTTLISRFDQRVHLRFEQEDLGPATKFIPIIKEYHANGDTKTQSQAIMICDDDQYYHPQTVSTLTKYADKYQDSIVGLRGWRGNYWIDKHLGMYLGFVAVRQDLIWGAPNLWERDYHVIYSHHLAQIYRVGVVTATSAYVIRPSFFDADLYRNFSGAPDDIRHVDDIWLSGQAARRRIPRYVVPSCCVHMGVTQHHSLQSYLGRHNMSRRSANSHALEWFREQWEKDIWYKLKGVNRPMDCSCWSVVYRAWNSAIQWTRFVLNFGFVYIWHDSWSVVR